MRTPARNARSAAALLALCAAGCFSSGNSDAFKLTTGSIALTLSAPANLTVSVTITGPEHFTATLTKSGLVEALTPGDYTVSATQATVQTSLIDTVWYANVPAKPLSVVEGKTLDLALEYTVRPGTSSIWLSHFGDTRLLGGWLGWDLMQGGNPAAASRLLTSYQQIAGLALDQTGALWLLAQDDGASTLVVFPAAAQTVGESQPAPVTISPNAQLSAFTFDSKGGVWAATSDKPTLVHYPAEQVQGGNLLLPDITITGTANTLQQVSALAFDSVGNLWVVNGGGGGSVSRYSPRELLGSGYYLPATSIQVATPGAMAFDAGGSLWVVSAGHLYQFDTGQLSTSGSHVPAVDLDFGDGTLSGFAFDALGQLWIVRTGNTDNRSALWMLSPGDLGKSGTVTRPYQPLVTDPDRGSPSLVLVNPTPAGLPLYGAAR